MKRLDAYTQVIYLLLFGIFFTLWIKEKNTMKAEVIIFIKNNQDTLCFAKNKSKYTAIPCEDISELIREK